MEPAYPAVPLTTRVMTAGFDRRCAGQGKGGWGISHLHTTRLPGCSFASSPVEGGGGGWGWWWTSAARFHSSSRMHQRVPTEEPTEEPHDGSNTREKSQRLRAVDASDKAACAAANWSCCCARRRSAPHRRVDASSPPIALRFLRCETIDLEFLHVPKHGGRTFVVTFDSEPRLIGPSDDGSFFAASSPPRQPRFVVPHGHTSLRALESRAASWPAHCVFRSVILYAIPWTRPSPPSTRASERARRDTLTAWAACGQRIPRTRRRRQLWAGARTGGGSGHTRMRRAVQQADEHARYLGRRRGVAAAHEPLRLCGYVW